MLKNLSSSVVAVVVSPLASSCPASCFDFPFYSYKHDAHFTYSRVLHVLRFLRCVQLDLGAHHLDLMFEDENDPPCAREARAVEEAHIRRWIRESAGYNE